MRSNYATLAQGKKMLAALEREALPIVKTGTVIGLDPRGRRHEMPVAQIDMRRRPDVADLVRVHRLEGPGDQRADWQFGFVPGAGSVACLTIRLKRPCRCRFRVLFDLVDHRPVLGRIAVHGGLLLTHMPLEEGAPVVVGSSILWQCPTAELREILAVADAAAALVQRGSAERLSRDG